MVRPGTSRTPPVMTRPGSPQACASTAVMREEKRMGGRETEVRSQKTEESSARGAGGQLGRALAEGGAGGFGGAAAIGHGEIGAAGEHVECVGVDEAAVVVADIDDDALAGAVLRVEVLVELSERAFGHIADMNVAEAVVTDLGDVGAVVLDPLAVDLIGERGHRLNGNGAPGNIEHD